LSVLLALESYGRNPALDTLETLHRSVMLIPESVSAGSGNSRRAAWSSSGSRVAVIEADLIVAKHRLTLFDVRRMQPLGQVDDTLVAAWGENDRYLATRGENNLQLWDIASGKLPVKLPDCPRIPRPSRMVGPIDLSKEVGLLRFCPENKWLILADTL